LIPVRDPTTAVLWTPVLLDSERSVIKGDSMRRSLWLLLAVAIAAALPMDGAFARKNDYRIRFKEMPAPADLPPDLAPEDHGPMYTQAVADTLRLAFFQFGSGAPDTQGWTLTDGTAQLATYFHIADGSELDGGTFGALLPLEGTKSAWCGLAASSAVPYCGYATLPGYANDWVQYLVSQEYVGCDSVDFCYKVQWDSEPGYDGTYIEWRDLSSTTWTPFVHYDGWGSVIDCQGARSTSGQGIQLRYRFESDGAWSDEDGLWPTDGAVLVDSITVVWYNEVPPSSGNWVVSATYFEDFEGEAPGDTITTDGGWQAQPAQGFGDFSALYPGAGLLQEDPCYMNFGFLWGYFDDPLVTNYSCHTPSPEPTQGAMRYGPDVNGLYLQSQIVSPLIPLVGTGDQFVLRFRSYRDLPLDNLQFYVWYSRTWINGCPTPFSNDNFVFYGGQRDWNVGTYQIGAHVNPAGSDVQIRLEAVDLCGIWCGIYGTGACHSHAPLLDEVELLRVNTAGPQFSVRHIDLFQDNFASNGTLTGTARADGALDIAPNASPTILPGDSLCVTASPIGTDANSGVGPAAYIYVAVWPPGQPGKAPAELEAPETRPNVGKRWPLVGTTVHDGVTWACFRMDSAVTMAGGIVADRYCVDLNDHVFTPGDTVCYIIAAADGAGNWQYWSRRLNGQGNDFVSDNLWEALNSPLEFTILPAGGHIRGGDILYVDDSDDRGGPVQLFFDSAFELIGIRDLVDRFDVLGPSSSVANSLASRVSNVQNQIVNIYRKIIWCSGNLSSGLIGDGTGNPEKSDDYSLLFQLLDTGPDNPGVYISGDDVAQEWVTLAGAGAINLRSIYMNFSLLNGDHVAAGEAVSPLLTATGPCFIHLGVPDKLIAYGGCALINDFDVLDATGLAQVEYPWPGGAGDAIISQATGNSAASTARVILSGFSYHYIRDIGPGYPPSRVEHLVDILNWLVNSFEINPTGITNAGARFFLENAAPNPFNPETVIRYGIKERGHVSLKVYNVAGQLVRTLVNEVKSPSESGFAVTWDGRNNAGQPVSSGVYFYKLTTGRYTQTKKMVLLK